jgi:glyoxylase-like metal-dependent hydrolase (beta-lactamase superfamily II)
VPTQRRSCRWLELTLGALLAGSCAGQAQKKDIGQLGAVPVAAGIWMLSGEGGNMAVAVGDEGALLVDADYARIAPRLAAAIRALTPRPLRFVLDTHWHPDHVESNAALAAQGAVIVAQDNVRVRLSTEQGLGAVRFPPAPPAGRPAITFPDTLTFHLGGSDVVAAWVGPAHTDGDVVALWRQANVIHAGDLVVDYGYPFIDAASGGNASGMVAALDRLLAVSDAGTRIIGGHGPLGSRADLVEYRDMLAGITGRVAGQLAAGKSLPQVIASRPSADFDARWAKPGTMPADTFVALIYRSLLPRPGS